MSEIAACTLIQEEPDRKTERYTPCLLYTSDAADE